MQLLLTLFKAIINRGSKKVQMEARRLEDEFVALKTAIEEAIIKGQKSVALFDRIPEWDLVSREDFARSCANAGSGIVGWIDDF
jgi:hypothetical protein